MEGRESKFKRDAQRRDRSHAQPHERSEEQIKLALGSLPLYTLQLTICEHDHARLVARVAPLRALIGPERAAQALANLLRTGSAALATCPRELAEHYRDECARHGLPCTIIPA